MASVSSTTSANHRTLKRSFTAVAISNPPSTERTATSRTAGLQTKKFRQRADRLSALSIQEGREYSSMMPSAAGPRMYENHIPSFMSVYDMDSTPLESSGHGPPPKLSASTFGQDPEQRQVNEVGNDHLHLRSQIHSHQHRESTSTQASDSTDSSPTTTISTVDSSSLSDPSPSSSPESPVTLVPLSSFSSTTFGLDSFQSLKMGDSSPPLLPLVDGRPMTSPTPRKPKNPKSLALNLSPTVDSFQASEPSSPSFIKPPTLKGRKKPSLLSLNTGAANNLISPEPLGSPGMPTMLQRRSLKHSVSTPQMLLTPGFGPSGGMTLKLPKLPLGTSRFKDSNLGTNTFTINEDAYEPPTGVQMATRVPGVTVGGDSFDRPHSGEDAKSPSYPDGPVLMHEPSVHLYLEPKLEEAMKFDVIINVAREVKNPFKVAEERDGRDGTQSDPTSATTSTTSSDIPPDTAATMMSFKTAFEVLPSGSTESSPTTPRPNTDKKEPEYIHVPWDHNTDVKDELWDLCELIEARTKEGKRVLVHCQQGASRSATLIIAYGMYINQDLGPNEAYKLAQSKSRWVNPNMSLLFSLNDFKKVIEKKKAEKNNPIRKTTVKHRPTLSADAAESPITPSRARGNSTPSAAARDAARNAVAKQENIPEPASAIDSAVARLGAFDFGFADNMRNNEVSYFGNVSATIQDRSTRETNEWEALMSPRLTEMTNNPLQSFSRGFGSEAEVPPTPALFSPRTFEFPRSSFFPSPANRNSIIVKEDPRSPPMKGEAPITRSIDDFL